MRYADKDPSLAYGSGRIPVDIGRAPELVTILQTGLFGWNGDIRPAESCMCTAETARFVRWADRCQFAI
jgi:hypothetical protein